MDATVRHILALRVARADLPYQEVPHHHRQNGRRRSADIPGDDAGGRHARIFHTHDQNTGRPCLADARESPGDELFAVAADGTCPAGTVGVVDHQGTAGIQSSVVVPRSAKKPATLPLTATSSASTPNKLSPQRCVATVSVTGPSGDLDGSNNVTQLVIDILDKNDF